MRSILLLTLLLASAHAWSFTWVYKVNLHDASGGGSDFVAVGPDKHPFDVVGVPCELEATQNKFRNLVCRFGDGDEAEIGYGCDAPGTQPLVMMYITRAKRTATVMLGCRP